MMGMTLLLMVGSGGARAPGLHCKVMILMGKTDPEAKAFAQQSMLLVDLASTDGIELVRPLTVFGDDDAPKGTSSFHLLMYDTQIKCIVAAGQGLEIAQRRLGPGRIHHCMRCIGQMERALSTMAQRAMKRVAFGKPLAARDSVLEDVARIRCEIDGCRHLVREAASLMDRKGNTDLETRQRLSLVKALVPHTLQSIADRAMQLHGGAGVSGDTPLTTIWATGRGFRLADGPDAVHWRKAGQLEFERQRSSPARALRVLRPVSGRAFLPVDDGPAVGGGGVVLGRVRGADEELVISGSLLPTRVVAVSRRWRIVGLSLRLPDGVEEDEARRSHRVSVTTDSLAEEHHGQHARQGGRRWPSRASRASWAL